MGIPNSHPIRFTPKGLADAFDATDKFPGACQSLANLVFDSSNPELVIARPGVVTIADLVALGIAGAGFISVQTTIGSRTYGMVASTLNVGKDQPFCYDHSTGALVAIAGIVVGNVPTSPSTSGAWTPPTMTMMGVYILITHPGYNGVGTNFFGVIDLTVPLAPVYSTQNTAINALPAVPVAVANLNNRAYFAINVTNATAKLYYTDALLIQRTNATQQLSVGDASSLVALAGLPVQTTSSGVLSALLAFKGTQLWQVTGDTTTSDLALNFISLSIGTSFPRSVAQSPAGTYFLSTNGPYFVDPMGALRPLTNRYDSMDPDLQTPFINATTPSRWAAGYAVGVYRACGPTILNGSSVTNDYWFDEKRRRWNGPHSFQYDCASNLGGAFVLSSATAPGKLFLGSPVQQLSSVFTDVGAPYSVNVLSSSFPKVGDMLQKQVAESQIELAKGATYTISAQDEGGNAIASPSSTVTLAVPGAATNLWGTGTWGAGLLWNSPVRTVPRTYAVPWAAPLVFEKMQLAVSATASANVQIGTFYARYQKTGYMTMGPST